MFWKNLFGYKYGNTRSYLRLPAAWPIKCQTQKGPEADKQVTQTQDVSAGGVSVTARERVPVGSVVHLEIYVPPLEKSLPAQGRVVRCSPGPKGLFNLGVRFTQIDMKDQAALNEAVEAFYSPRERDRQHSGAWWRRLR